MKNDMLNSFWKAIPTSKKSTLELTEMLKERNHPVLKSIRKQIFFEVLAFFIFLSCYYNMFDGANKPILVNFALVFSILLIILHHLKGYYLQKKFRSSINLKADLKNYIVSLKHFHIETIIIRIVFVTGILSFFTYGIQLSENKWWIIALATIVLIAQIIFLHIIWIKRIHKFKATLHELESI